MEKKPNFFVKFFSDMIPVMIGVFLGFSLNNFAEKQRIEQHTTNFTSMIKNEILTNQQNIERVYEYHNNLKADVDSLRQSRNLKEAMNGYAFNGLRPGSVDNSAFRTGVQSGIIQEMDLSLIQKINMLYNLQDDYQEFNKAMIASILNKDFPTTEMEIEKLLVSVKMNMNDVTSFEERLMEKYIEIISDL